MELADAYFCMKANRKLQSQYLYLFYFLQTTEPVLSFFHEKLSSHHFVIVAIQFLQLWA